MRSCAEPDCFAASGSLDMSRDRHTRNHQSNLWLGVKYCIPDIHNHGHDKIAQLGEDRPLFVAKGDVVSIVGRTLCSIADSMS